MQDYNKKNLYFLLCVFGATLVVFFTVVMLTYVGKEGIWSVPIPIAAEGYSVYCLVKRAIKFKKDSKIKNEDEL